MNRTQSDDETHQKQAEECFTMVGPVPPGGAPGAFEKPVAGVEIPVVPYNQNSARTAVENQYIFEGIPVIRGKTEPVPPDAVCRLTGERGDPSMLFKPCKCGWVNRYAFKKWRQGWINPRNYFSCPDCMYSYKIERVNTGKEETPTKAAIRRKYRCKLALFWLVLLLVIGGTIAGLSGIYYAIDNGNKNIPVAVKALLTSVVSGFPHSNSTDAWRDEFRRPDVAVWPYYTLLGAFTGALIVLTIFACRGCSFDENDQKVSKCDTCSCCRNTGGCDGVPYCYCYNPCPTPHQARSDVADCPCNACTTDCGKCDTDMDCEGGGQALAIILVVIILIVLVSAIVVIILYAVKKCAVFHDQFAKTILAQAEELENETIVLGMTESLRPSDAV